MSRIKDTLYLFAFGAVLVTLCALTLIARFCVDLWTIWKPKGNR